MNAPEPQPDLAKPDVSSYLREAAGALDRAASAPPLEVQLGASQAEMQVVQARDALIAWLREAPSSAESKPQKNLLNQLNAILSIIVGVEYPSNYIRREMITQARDLLQGALAGQNPS